MRRLKVIGVLLCVVLGAQAQLLYKISGNSAAEPSYIVGTNKYIDMTYLDSIPGLFKAFGKCNTVVTEFAFQDYEALAAMRKLPLTSAYAYSAVRDSIMAARLGYDPNRSMDAFFPVVAEEQGKKVVGLDNVGETLWILFERHDEAYLSEQLGKLIGFPEYDVELEQEIMRLYRRKQLWDIAYAVSGPDNKATFNYADYDIYAKRNVEWVKRLAPLLRQGGCFIAVDAMLLGAERGLLEQLRKAGYKVKPIRRP